MKKTTMKRISGMVMAVSTFLACGSLVSAEDVTEVTFWNSMDTTYGEMLNAQIETFNETIGAEKGIHVTSVFQSYPGTEALSAALSADDYENMPDVIQLYSESVSLVRDSERLVWAEDLMSEGGSLKAEDIIPSVRNSFTINSRMVGVPYNIAGYLLYYNEDQLQAAGYAEPPKTIAEMAEMLPVLVENTDAEYGLNVRINMNEFLNFVETQGAEGSLFGNNNNGHESFLTELQCVEEGTFDAYINAWQDIIDSGAYKPEKESINEEFAFGLNSMVIMSSSRMHTIDELVDGSFNWNVAPVPTVNTEDAGGSFPTGAGLFVLNREDDAKVQAAWEFVQYMASADVQAQWVQNTGYIPVNVKAIESAAYSDYVAENPKFAVPYDVLSQSAEIISSPFVPNYKDVDTLIQNTMLSFANGEMDAETVSGTLKDGIAEVFEEYYRSNPIE